MAITTPFESYVEVGIQTVATAYGCLPAAPKPTYAIDQPRGPA